MIYYILTKAFPFNDRKGNYFIFEKIKKLDFHYPKSMDVLTRDCIQKLLKRKPKDRIGTDAPGSGNDFNAIRTHPFFDGIDFTDLHL